MLQHINALIFTLNNIEVKGEKNLDMLLGCIKTLQKMKEEAIEAEKTKGVSE